MAYQMPRDPTNVIGRRIVAFIIDWILIDAILVALFAGTKKASFTNAPNNACDILRAQSSKSLSCLQLGSHVYTWDSGRVLTVIGLSILVAALNFVVLQGISGASVGKLMLGLRVINAEGRVCGVGRALVRWIVGFVDLLCAGLVGLITVLATKPHRRVGDMAGGTYVVATADVGTPIASVSAQAPAYAYSGAGWTPPAPGAQPWETQPAPAQPQPGSWPPPASQQPAWGAPAQQPPVQQPPMQQPPPPPPPAPPMPPAQPQPAPPSWGAPPQPAQPPAQPQPAPPSWGAPPQPAQPPAQPQGETWWDKTSDDEEPKQ